MLGRVVAVVGLLVAGGAQAQAPVGPQQWLCVADQSTGFSFDKSTKRWKTAVFHENKYILRRPNKSDNLTKAVLWVVIRIGEKSPTDEYTQEFNENYIFCHDITSLFVLNSQTLRFTRTRVGDFTLNSEETTDVVGEPSVEIGKCSPL